MTNTISLAMRLSFSKVFGSRVRVESTGKVAELELAEKVKYFLENLQNGCNLLY